MTSTTQSEGRWIDYDWVWEAADTTKKSLSRERDATIIMANYDGSLELLISHLPQIQSERLEQIGMDIARPRDVLDTRGIVSANHFDQIYCYWDGMKNVS